MKLLWTFLRLYRWQSVAMLAAFLLAGVAEGVSLSALLPLLGLVAEGSLGEAPVVQSEPSQLEQAVQDSFAWLGMDVTLANVLIVIVVGLTLKNVLLFFARRTVGYTAARVATNLRKTLLNAMMRTRWEYFVHQSVGRLATAMAMESDRAAQAYVAGTMFIALFIQAGVYAGVAFAISWQATVAALVLAAAIALMFRALVRMSGKAGAKQTKVMRTLIARLADTLNSVKSLKAMGCEGLADTVLSKETDRLNDALEREVLSKTIMDTAQEPVFAVVIALGLFFALDTFGMTFATAAVLMVVLARVMKHIGGLQKQYQKMAVGESAFWALQGTVDEARRLEEHTEGDEPPRFARQISLQGVSFGYEEKTVLADVSLEIPRNRLTVLVGDSGSGKTTIADLVIGLMFPQSGLVCLDDMPLPRVDIMAWRRMIGYVPQESILLHDSILSNVTLGDDRVNAADAERALRQAGAWEFVRHLPEGMDTVVGERGSKLSGGQRQRIMLARALVHEPSLLILDEATSALDPRTEAEICGTLSDLKADVTILAISHQTGLVNVADRVYRVAGGTVTPAGGDHPA